MAVESRADTYEEGRHVLSAQRSDIDDKALRTVRITAVILGVGATGVRVIGIDNLNESVAVASLVSFFLSLVFGVIVYNESNEVVGPTAEYLGIMRRNEMHADCQDDLLVQFQQWIDDSQEIVEFNGHLLVACQLFFAFGVGLGVASLLALGVLELVILGSVSLGLIIATLAMVHHGLDDT